MGNGQSTADFLDPDKQSPCIQNKCRSKSGVAAWGCVYQCNIEEVFGGVAGTAGSVLGDTSGAFFQGIFGDSWPIFVVGGAVIIGGIVLIILLK